MLSGGFIEMHCGGFSCSGIGATNLNSKDPTSFRSERHNFPNKKMTELAMQSAA